MKSNNYIAVLLVTIFMVKFFVVDAKGLGILFNDSDIIFVNPNCKKQNSKKQTDHIADFSKVELGTSQAIHLSGFCTSQFKLEIFSWESNFSVPITVFNEHFSYRLSYLYLDKISPPPRLT